ncbi:hypothetical protein C2G38_2188937 [Gigaspora rosea]|uniref:Aldehyde oxidase/xanthine dehydrogenase first molybdopterin binding domain-containing protein n=1 Tax=Gigaspora rosea TaxID=44941 RepID=A0A397VA00_9GLOM|nr:hypothetical protein C2G38_2188937 [Gigaspora rosea]
MRCRKGLQGADYIFEGESRSGAQDMETNAALVIPKHKDDEFEIHSGSQSHSSIQEKVAEHWLGSWCLVSQQTIRCVLDRSEDIIITG